MKSNFFFTLFYPWLFLGTPASSAASTGFNFAFNKPTASATPFSLTTVATTSSSAPAGAGLTFGSVLTATAPQQPAALGFTLGGLGGTTTTTVPSLGGGLFSTTTSTGMIWTLHYLTFIFWKRFQCFVVYYQAFYLCSKVWDRPLLEQGVV